MLPLIRFLNIANSAIWISILMIKDAFHCAEQILHENGYLDEEELSDHHTTYRYTFEKTGRSFLLELHYRVVGVYQYKPANQLSMKSFPLKI